METSIIIPVYNDPEGLEVTVDSLLDQTHDDYEIIIADNGSTDSTSDVAEEFAEIENVYHVIEDRIQTSYAARNTGIENSSGEIIGFLDADMYVDSDYVESITTKMIEHNRDYMGCEVKLVGDDSIISRYNKASGFPVETFINDSQFAPTNCLVTRRRVFETIGYFDERLISTGDVIFGRKAHAAGFELVYEPEITVYHPTRTELREHISKAIRIGRGREQIRRFGIDDVSNRSIFHPRNYLPPDPVYFYKSLSGCYTSPTQIILFYVFSCFIKYCTTYGRIIEFTNPKSIP